MTENAIARLEVIFSYYLSEMRIRTTFGTLETEDPSSFFDEFPREGTYLSKRVPSRTPGELVNDLSGHRLLLHDTTENIIKFLNMIKSRASEKGVDLDNRVVNTKCVLDELLIQGDSRAIIQQFYRESSGTPLEKILGEKIRPGRVSFMLDNDDDSNAFSVTIKPGVGNASNFTTISWLIVRKNVTEMLASLEKVPAVFSWIKKLAQGA